MASHTTGICFIEEPPVLASDENYGSPLELRWSMEIFIEY
jgi:hypothetical protein